MARNRGKKALYEVMSTARAKSGVPPSNREQSVPRAGRGDARDTMATGAGSQPAGAKGAATWWRRPRTVQLNAGRIEFSVPYQIAVAAALVLVFVLLASYRLGQSSGQDGRQGPSAAQGSVTEAPEVTGRAASDVRPPSAPVRETPEPKKVEPVVPAGDNVIVLAHYHTMADLQPVLAHFAAHNIETEIVPENGRYLLQTKQKYVSTARGSDGYKAIEKIREVGALYKGKAPPGYEPFAPHYFSDAYGKKVK